MNEIVINKEVDRVPIYVWSDRKAIQLSRKVWVVARSRVEGKSWEGCARVVKEECGIEVSWKTCQRWMKHGINEKIVAEGMEKEAKMAWMDKVTWFSMMFDHLNGIKRLKDGDLYGMNLWAKYKGWEQMDVFNNNVQINFTQANGKV